jgi:hypothetical protein
MYLFKNQRNKSSLLTISLQFRVEMVASFRVRPEDAHTANNFRAFPEETFRFIGDKKIGLLILDFGFYDRGIFDYLEGRETPVNYIMATPMYQPVQ